MQRRCKSGKLVARLETGEDGASWLIDGGTLPTGAVKVPTGDATPFTSESTHSAAIVPPDVATLPTGAVNELVDQLRTENAFLRGAVEQHQRSEAELRAALRKALEAMPKQLTGNSDEVDVRDATQTRPASETRMDAPPQSQQPARREPRPLWKLLLGLR